MSYASPDLVRPFRLPNCLKFRWDVERPIAGRVEAGAAKGSTGSSDSGRRRSPPCMRRKIRSLGFGRTGALHRAVGRH